MSDIVKTVRQGISQFEYDTKCGLIAVETLAVHREVLIKLCDEIDSLRKVKREWIGLTNDDVVDAWHEWQPKSNDIEMFAEIIEAKLKEKNHG
jgi:hypothetical protein